ncbi:hypothetical protein CEY11_21305 [Candidimonas nitroreducens]|uniref:Uncharacterized protein n=2 Tax=Candidimonas nitroreducens TaxID=683354 RepID=A0A225M550_9BURK|nr:hypothetical protein CEY11_21305 [Candidimonas nitroreducens]
MCTTTQPYTIDNEHGVSIWWANGWWFVAICCPAEEKLGLIGRTRVWLAARRWLRIHGDIYNKNAVAMAKLLGGDTCDEQGSGK